MIIRCHQMGKEENELYLKLRTAFRQEDIFFAYDAIHGNPNIERENLFKITQEFCDQNGFLSDFEKITWRCGDYAVYQIFVEYDHYQYYYMFEPDVGFKKELLEKFLHFLRHTEADFLAARYERKQSNWFWSKHIEKSYGPLSEVFGRLFAMVRLSNEVVRFLMKERKNLSQRFQEEDISRTLFPNDESFCSNVLRQNDFLCGGFGPFVDERTFNLNRVFLEEHIRDTVFYHPIVYDHQTFLKSGKMRISGPVLSTLLERIKERMEDNGRDPLILNATLRQINDRIIRHNQLTHYPRQSVIVRRKKKSKFGTARIEDFLLGPQTLVKEWDISSYTPYAFDGKKSIFHLVDTDERVFRHPFFYMGQFQYANTVLSVKMSEVNTKEFNQDRLTLIFSIGRSGSSLATKLFAALGYAGISECDIFNGMLNARKGKEIINKAIGLLSSHYLTRDKELVLKFKTSSNKDVALFMELYPKARYIFLYRNKQDWAQSYISKFKWKSKLLLHTYRQGFECLTKLARSKVNLLILSYKELVENPDAFV